MADGAGGGLVWAGGGWEALLTAAVALASARATAKGMDGLAGEGSHLDLFMGLPDSPSSCVACRVLLGACVGLAGTGPVLGEVLVVLESLVLLPALTQVLGDGSATTSLSASSGTATSAAPSAITATAAAAASSGASSGTAVSCPCVAVAAPTTEVPESYFVSI